MAVAASSNPITSVAPSSSPITSVPDTLYPPSYQQQQQQQLLSRLTLEMRGERFVVERETLLNLPESVLLGMFPNGLILSRQQLGWPEEEDDGENQVYPIDVSRAMGFGLARCSDRLIFLSSSHSVTLVHLLFPTSLDLNNSPTLPLIRTANPHQFDPSSFRYILSFWSKAHTDFYGTSSSPGYFHKQQHLNPNNSASNSYSASSSGAYNSSHSADYPAGPGENPLISRQPIIVLREELEYFSIVPSSDPSVNPQAQSSSSSSQGLPSKILQAARVNPDGTPTEELLRLKKEAGKALLKRTKVFTALQRNVSKEGNLAEQHLIDMLCMS